MPDAAPAHNAAEHLRAAGALRFPALIAQAIAQDDRRIVIIGAGGWIGRSVLEMLHGALGAGELARRVTCFGSTARDLVLNDGTTITQASMAELPSLPPKRSIVLHLAFLTMDKVGSVAENDYIAGNRRISDTVAVALDRIGADRLFLASSGAAAFASDPTAAANLRLYGRLKRDDEERFAAWATATTGRRAAIGRLYALSGPFINKPETYALADFIIAALNKKPITVRAPLAVYRSYVPVREIMSLVFAMLLAPENPAVIRFDTGGETLELEALAAKVATVLGGEVKRAQIGDGPENRYAGDHARWQQLLAEYGLSHLPIEQQIAETADYLSKRVGLPADA